jgi:NLE (NUC135) domain
MMVPAGPQLDLPQDVTVQQLETLLNGLLANEEKLPYSFFVDDVELAAELGQHLLKHKVCGRCLPALQLTLRFCTHTSLQHCSRDDCSAAIVWYFAPGVRCQWRQRWRSHTSRRQCSGCARCHDAQPPCQASLS